MIEAVGLHKSFGETHALRGLDFDVREGTILGMFGPNGAGKTTAVRILTNLWSRELEHRHLIEAYVGGG